MNSFLIYLIVMLDNIKILMVVIFILTIPAMIITISLYTDKECSEKTFVDIMKKVGAISVISLLLICFTPSTKQMAVIYVAPKVISNINVKQLPDKLVKLSNSWVDSQIKKLN